MILIAEPLTAAQAGKPRASGDDPAALTGWERMRA